MASYVKRGERWLVRWKELFVTRQTDGTEVREWRDRGRTVPTERDAKRLVAEVEKAGRVEGVRWEDQREQAISTLGAIADGYIAAAAAAPKATQKWRRSLMKHWIGWAGATTPSVTLSVSFLERYAAGLPTAGRAAATRHRRILEVERMWKWARRRPDLYPGVPEAQEITGREAGDVKPPPPVVRLAAPTLADVDAMIANLRAGYHFGDLHRRVALFLRYTGLRLGQVLGLRWADLRLEDEAAGPYLIVRAGRVGAKASRGRAVPLHPALVAELAGWGVREGAVFAPPAARVTEDGRTMRGATWEDGEATRTAFRTAWNRSGVDPAKWDVTDAERETGERAHGSPAHAIRAAVKVHLLRSGVAEAVANYFIGHTQGATTMAYVPEHSPETSPYWPALRDAVATLTDHREAANVIRLRG